MKEEIGITKLTYLEKCISDLMNRVSELEDSDHLSEVYEKGFKAGVRYMEEKHSL